MTSLPLDPEKSARETLRWLILLTLDAARPLGASELLILNTVTQVLPETTARELRRQLSYLAERGQVHLEGQDGPQWRATLNRYGIDIIEYTIPCEPGIARPKKYWGAD